MASFSRVGSPTWRRLLQIRHKAEEHIFWQFGQGMVDFWRDKWVTNESLYLVCGKDNPPISLVGEFFLHDSWNRDKLTLVVPEYLVELISQLVFKPMEGDLAVWNLSSTGKFTTSSAYDFLRKRKAESMVSHIIWSPLVPKKMAFLSWRILNKCLPTDDV